MAHLLRSHGPLGGTSLNDGIRVVGISPGDMENERGIMFLGRQAEKAFGDVDRWREMMSDLPGGSAPSSEDMANAIAFLASPRARYISGTVLTIDGGLSASQAVNHKAASSMDATYLLTNKDHPHIICPFRVSE